MESLTTGASTKDWLDAIKGMTIRAYIEPDILERGGDDQPLTGEQFEDAPGRVSRPEKPQPNEAKSET